MGRSQIEAGYGMRRLSGRWNMFGKLLLLSTLPRLKIHQENSNTHSERMGGQPVIADGTLIGLFRNGRRGWKWKWCGMRGSLRRKCGIRVMAGEEEGSEGGGCWAYRREVLRDRRDRSSNVDRCERAGRKMQRRRNEEYNTSHTITRLESCSLDIHAT